MEAPKGVTMGKCHPGVLDARMDGNLQKKKKKVRFAVCSNEYIGNSSL